VIQHVRFTHNQGETIDQFRLRVLDEIEGDVLPRDIVKALSDAITEECPGVHVIAGDRK